MPLRSASLLFYKAPPPAPQQIVQAFYKRLFGCEQLRYFFVNMSTERLRNMQVGAAGPKAPKA